MIKEEGLGAIYKGLTPTLMRQAANSAIRFTVYGAIKDHILEGRPKPSSLSPAESFGAGIVAGYGWGMVGAHHCCFRICPAPAFFVSQRRSCNVLHEAACILARIMV